MNQKELIEGYVNAYLPLIKEGKLTTQELVKKTRKMLNEVLLDVNHQAGTTNLDQVTDLVGYFNQNKLGERGEVSYSLGASVIEKILTKLAAGDNNIMPEKLVFGENMGLYYLLRKDSPNTYNLITNALKAMAERKVRPWPQLITYACEWTPDFRSGSADPLTASLKQIGKIYPDIQGMRAYLKKIQTTEMQSLSQGAYDPEGVYRGQPERSGYVEKSGQARQNDTERYHQDNEQNGMHSAIKAQQLGQSKPLSRPEAKNINNMSDDERAAFLKTKRPNFPAAA